jgi:membrane protein DedA with SNARE-associated domain
MDKIHELTHFIAHYGYLAIFILVFLQEIGVPNPATNEVMLMFGGYLSYSHSLSIFKVILVVITADVTGTCILFFTFYFFGNWLISHKPKWLQVKSTAIDRLKRHLSSKGQWSIFVGRLTPFLRGYVSVAAGILHIKPQKFLATVSLSALIWGGGFVVLGWIIAPYWNIAVDKLGIIENIVLILLVILAITLTGRYIIKQKLIPKQEIN